MKKNEEGSSQRIVVPGDSRTVRTARYVDGPKLAGFGMGPGVSPPLLSCYDLKPRSGFEPECMRSICREERGHSARKR